MLIQYNCTMQECSVMTSFSSPRSVLTKVELEGLPIDGNVREDVERGKVKERYHESNINFYSIVFPQVCFLCMKTKFGLFSRGQKCEMCKQIVCHRCYTKVRSRSIFLFSLKNVSRFVCVIVRAYVAIASSAALEAFRVHERELPHLWTRSSSWMDN